MVIPYQHFKKQFSKLCHTLNTYRMICGNSSAKTPGYEIQGVYGGGDTQCGLTSYIIILSLEGGHQCFRGTHQIHHQDES